MNSVDEIMKKIEQLNEDIDFVTSVVFLMLEEDDQNIKINMDERRVLKLHCRYEFLVVI